MPRTTRTKETAGGLLEQIQGQVDQLIEENKQLKKEIAKFQGGGMISLDRRTLAGMNRRLETVLGAPVRRSRTAARRKVTDPETLEKRRAALAKARAVLAEKRNS